MHRRAADIFHEARELPATRRDTFLLGACGKDLALRAKVDALLEADAAAGNFMASPTADGVVRAPSAAGTGTEQPGVQIGRYKLLEQIGEGGMGTIWMAEQREPVRRRVALKIIKLGMDTKQVVARFEAERQALAMMDHPNIAKVLDAGATEAGRPYFVMEYIKGIPILDYCDQEKVDTKARLELFASVCQAIQHAHQKGIIHRDIKPSNVLVTLHDGVPVPKVIDFGIAKATNSELTNKTLFTEHRQMIGTPAYMSPEQAELSGLDIDTRSDIYSLGVLLYELLTGTTPFDTRELLTRGFAEMMRTIREDEPQKPSNRVSTLGETGTRTALQRRADVKKLGSLLRGDIDWIVMKCLEKDRSRRYETANGLAADIRRHLANEPVTAGAPSAAYKLRKFVQRNRGRVFAGAAVVVALMVGVVGFAWQAQEASLQRDEAEQARVAEAEQRRVADLARAEAERHRAIAVQQEAEARKQEAEARLMEEEARNQAAIAEAVAKFQTDMLAAVDPGHLPRDPVTGEPLRDQVTVVQAMAAAIKLLDEGSVADQPYVEAKVRGTIGSTLEKLGRYADAEANLRKSLAIFRAGYPAGHRNLGAPVNNLAVLLRYLGKLDEAEPLTREAVEIARTSFPAQHPNVAIGLNGLASLLESRNKLDEAEELSREALAIARACHKDGNTELASHLNVLASVLGAKGEHEEAESLCRESLVILRAAYPDGHPEVAAALGRLATILRATKQPAKAEPLLREALALNQALLPAGHSTIAFSMKNLATVLHESGRSEEAEQLYRAALPTLQAAYPAGHSAIATARFHLAGLLKDRKRFAEAEPLLREALVGFRGSGSKPEQALAAALKMLAETLEELQKPAEAEPFYREALALRRANAATAPLDLAIGLNDLGRNLAGSGRHAEAEALYREALPLWRAQRPAGHRDVAAALGNLASVLRAQKRYREAEPLSREALAIRRAAPDQSQDGYREELGSLAVICWNLRKFDESVPMLEELLAASEAALGRRHPDTLHVLGNLGVNYKDAGRLAEAIPLLEEAFGAAAVAPSIAWAGHPLLEAYEQAVDPAKPETLARCLDHLRRFFADDELLRASRLSVVALKLLASKAWHQAEPLVRECLASREKALPDDWRTFNAKSMLGAACLGQDKLAEAEPLLLEGFRGLKEREASIPAEGFPRLIEAAERLVWLYTVRGDAAAVERWQRELVMVQAKAPKAAPVGGKE